MHIHANLTNPNVASLYAAEAEQKAAAARQAVEVRKKLLLSASKLSSEFQIREFSSDQEPQEETTTDQAEHSRATKNTADETQYDNPISMWA